MKATPNPYILKILKDYGCGVDCASMAELMMGYALDYKPEEIMFSSNDTPAEEYAYANEIGATINLDDITHIEFLDKILDGKFPETMSCRYNPGGYFQLGTSIMDNPGDAKYGMTHDQIIEAFKILKSKGVKHFGIHSFLASNTVSNEYYPTLAKILFELAVELQDSHMEKHKSSKLCIDCNITHSGRTKNLIIYLVYPFTDNCNIVRLHMAVL